MRAITLSLFNIVKLYEVKVVISTMAHIRPLWSAPAHQLNSLTIKAALSNVVVPSFCHEYRVMPFRCMIDDADLDRCETQIAAWRRKMELELMDMEEVILLKF